MGKYAEMSEMALEAFGGVENITHVTHCATRLRISYQKKSLIKEDLLKNLPESAGLVNKDHQVQIIIGPKVHDAYLEFIEISGWKEGAEGKTEAEEQEETGKKNAMYWMNKFGNFMAPIFMPIIPALIVGGMILAISKLCINYLGMNTDSGTAQLCMAIFDAGFSFLPIWIAMTLSKQLKMPEIYGMMVAGVMVGTRLAGGTVTDFFGIPIPQLTYTSTVFPIFLAVIFESFVYKGVKKIMPEALTFFMTPLITILISTPVALIILGPIGNSFSSAVGSFVLWMSDVLGFLAIPILSMIYPYLVMFGMDKALTPIGVDLVATIGYNPLTLVAGFISNICIGSAALAVAMQTKEKLRKGVYTSCGITALCGVTEPAFYGALLSHPQALIGTAVGAGIAGLFAGVMGLRTFVHGGCPGYLTLLFFVDHDGGLYHVMVAIITALIATAVPFLVATLILRRANKGK